MSNGKFQNCKNHDYEYICTNLMSSLHCLLLLVGIAGSWVRLSSVRFSRSVMSDSLWPHESQHARLPFHLPTHTTWLQILSSWLPSYEILSKFLKLSKLVSSLEGKKRNNNNPYLCLFPMFVKLELGEETCILCSCSFPFFSSYPPIFLSSSFSPSLPLCLPSLFLPAFLISSSFSSHSPVQLGWSRIYDGPAPRSRVEIFESLLLLLLNKVHFSRCTAKILRHPGEVCSKESFKFQTIKKTVEQNSDLPSGRWVTGRGLYL